MRFLRKEQTLSKVEKTKLERHPLEVYGAIIDTYSKYLSAMDEVPGEVERLKWVGIYPQKQGGDAFMMRIKIPGCVLTPGQTRVVGKIAADFARARAQPALRKQFPRSDHAPGRADALNQDGARA